MLQMQTTDFHSNTELPLMCHTCIKSIHSNSIHVFQEPDNPDNLVLNLQQKLKTIQ